MRNFMLSTRAPIADLNAKEIASAVVLRVEMVPVAKGLAVKAAPAVTVAMDPVRPVEIIVVQEETGAEAPVQATAAPSGLATGPAGARIRIFDANRHRPFRKSRSRSCPTKKESSRSPGKSR